MSPSKERRFLAALIARRDKSQHPTGRRNWLHVGAWIALTLALLFLFQTFRVPLVREWVWILGALVVGAVIGARAVYDASRDQWPALEQHLDFDSVRARIAELER